jgi:hypothetical protein
MASEPITSNFLYVNGSIRIVTISKTLQNKKLGIKILFL